MNYKIKKNEKRPQVKELDKNNTFSDIGNQEALNRLPVEPDNSVEILNSVYENDNKNAVSAEND